MSDQALEKIEKLVNGEIPNGKFQLLRMYGAFERDQERNKIIDAFRERVSNFILDDIIIFSENEAVCTVKRRDNKNIIYYISIKKKTALSLSFVFISFLRLRL